jgi:hypothetical protein
MEQVEALGGPADLTIRRRFGVVPSVLLRGWSRDLSQNLLDFKGKIA